MTGRLAGKTALVTGGSRGIGAAIVERLAADGARVVFTYAGNRAAADAVSGRVAGAGGSARAIQADAGDPAATRAAVEQAAELLGGFDIVVHNAGIAEFAPLPEVGEDSFRRQFAINVDGVFFGSRAAIGHVRDGGRILVIGSVNAHTMPTPGGAIYGATKAAVAALVRGWARDLGPRAITVNTVQPGPVDTDLNPADGDLARYLTPRIALGRYGRAEEIAALTAFLASDEASFVTGAAIDIDGGFAI